MLKMELVINQSRLGRRNPSADSLVAYISSFAYWIPFAYASSPLLKLSQHNPDDFFFVSYQNLIYFNLDQLNH